jgi:hypothetical protein
LFLFEIRGFALLLAGAKRTARGVFFSSERGSLFFVEKVTGKRSSQAKNTSHSLGIIF